MTEQPSGARPRRPAAAKKTPTKSTSAKTTAAKKTAAKKTAAKTAPAKSAAKTPAKKTTARAASPRKASVRKTSAVKTLPPPPGRTATPPPPPPATAPAPSAPAAVISGGTAYPAPPAAPVAAPAAGTAAANVGDRPPHHSLAWALIGASALVFLGSLLPWVSAVTPFGTVSIAGTDVDGVITLIAALVVAGIAAALLMGKRPRLWAYVVVLVAAALCAFVGIYDLADVSNAAGNEFAHVSPGAGLWITALASIALLVVAVQTTRKRPRPALA